MILRPMRLLIAALLVLIVLPIGVVFAQNTPLQSQMLNLKLESVASQNGAVIGSVTLNNNSDKNFSESYLTVSLISPGTTTSLKSGNQDITIQNSGQLIEFSKTEFFPIKPGDVIKKSISVKYPPTIKTGQYSLVVEVKDKDNSSQGSASTSIDLSGSGDFLDVSQNNCRITIGSKVFNSVEGPNIGKDETGVLTCAVQNNTDKSIEAKPQVIYAVNSVSGDSSSVNPLTLTSSIVVGPGQTGSVRVNIPKNLPPQVYEGLLFLVDNSNQRISASVPFRWIITGPSAVIRNLDLDKSYYKAGQTANVSILALPSVDLSWRGGNVQNPGYSPSAGTDLKNPRVSVKILDNSNQLCGEKEQSMPPTTQNPNWKELVIGVPISRECKNPKVEAAIYEQGIAAPLAALTKGVVTTETDLQIAAPQVGRDIPWVWFLVGIAAVVIGVTGFMFWRKRKKLPPPPSAPGNSAPQNQGTGSTAPVNPVTAALIIILMSGVLWVGQNKSLFKNPFIVHAQQQFSVFQGLAKSPVNNTDVNTKTVSVQRGDVRFGTNTYAPIEWGNVRDFAENGTGGDSSVIVSPDCRSAKITIRGTSTTDFACVNWASGIAVANFVDNQAATPSALTPLDQSEVIIPSLQVSPSAFANYSTYGAHIINIHKYNSPGPRSATYTLNFPNGLSEGTHKLLLQVAASNLTQHLTGIDSYFSSFERLASSSAQPTASSSALLTANNCGGTEPCFINLEKEFSCGPIPACNQSCSNQKDCEFAPNGCTECRPSPEGPNTCQPPPPACNAACSGDKDCFGNKNGCNACVDGVCKVPPACNSSCTKDSQCAKAVDGCIACVGGVCKPPPACGTACTTKAECSGVKDGCSECLEGTCTNYNDNMCKCDGMVADIVYPSTSFNFEAFGKVNGSDAKKAEIADITFRLTRDNQVVAKSNPITPTVTESSSDKVRFKAAWSTAPPAVVRGATYRVFADVRCKPKKIVASAKENFSPNMSVVAAQPKPPIGLKLVMDLIDKLFNSRTWAGRAIVGDVMAQLASPSPSNQSPLQLQTLNFVKLMDTDNCRFVMFKFDETLF